MSPKSEKFVIIIIVSLLICIFGALLFHNIKYLSIHILGEKKEFILTSNSYRLVQRKHRKNYSDEAFTHAVDYFVDYNNFTYLVFSEAKVANSKNSEGMMYYRERIGEKAILYYLNNVGISEGNNKNLKLNIGAFFFLVLMEFSLILGLKLQFFSSKKDNVSK